MPWKSGTSAYTGPPADNDPLVGDWSDRAIQLQNDEVLQAIDDAARDELVAIDEALHRIERGLYGVCKYAAHRSCPADSRPCMRGAVRDVQPIDGRGISVLTRVKGTIACFREWLPWHNLHRLRSDDE